MGQGLARSIAFAFILLASAAQAWSGAQQPPTAAIYGGGPLYRDGGALDQLRESGFTTVIAWTLHVGAEGDLAFNDQPLVAGGRYVGDPAWPGRLAELKRGGSVNRLLFSVGSAGVADFQHIQALIRDGGAGPGSRLRNGFQALKAAIPAIDGFDLDDEDLRDPATTVAFAALLGQLGCRVTFCPYNDMDFWVACLGDLEAAAPGLVAALHLQCYEGGIGNDPQAWMAAISARLGKGFDAAGILQPGLWCRHGADCRDGDDPQAVAARFTGWKTQGVRGGFLWLFDDLMACQGAGPEAQDAGAYARAIRQPLAP